MTAPSSLLLLLIIRNASTPPTRAANNGMPTPKPTFMAVFEDFSDESFCGVVVVVFVELVSEAALFGAEDENWVPDVVEAED